MAIRMCTRVCAKSAFSPVANFTVKVGCAMSCLLSLFGISVLCMAAENGGRIAARFSTLPLRFEANEGQTNPIVKFVSRGPNYTLFLTGDQVVLSLAQASNRTSRKLDLLHGVAAPPKPKAVVTMAWIGARPTVRISGSDELPGRSNYFHRNDPTKWRTGIRNYARVLYRDIYPGIDITYYGSQRQLEYDISLAPGADPSALRLAFTGAQKLRVDRQGDLVIDTTSGEIRQQKPIIYQKLAGTKKIVDGGYEITRNGEVTFRLATYDRSKGLVVDPVLSYSTYIGGSQEDAANAIAVDRKGNAYITGYTMSLDFPSTEGETFMGGNPVSFYVPGGDAFVTKIAAAGDRIVYSTYLGGTGADSGIAIDVDDRGDAYLTGGTVSVDFPLTAGALQSAFAGGTGDAFVAKLNSQGDRLLYSTYLGGTGLDIGTGIALDRKGDAFVTGFTQSHNFPVQSPLQPNNANPFTADVFVTKIDANGDQLLFSTYLGGDNSDAANGIALDRQGDAYVTGYTDSDDFPTHNAYQDHLIGLGYDSFVAKLKGDGTRLIFSTYLGGSGGNDFSNSIDVDRDGECVVVGFTDSKDFPLRHPLQRTYSDEFQAFVTKFDSSGQHLRYSTYLGGSDGDIASAVRVDASGNAYITGFTRSTDFPLKKAFQATLDGIQAAFVTKIDAHGDEILYSTYLGGSSGASGRGIAVSNRQDTFVTGFAGPNLPTTREAVQKTNAGSDDAFVVKLSDHPWIRSDLRERFGAYDRNNDQDSNENWTRQH